MNGAKESLYVSCLFGIVAKQICRDFARNSQTMTSIPSVNKKILVVGGM